MPSYRRNANVYPRVAGLPLRRGIILPEFQYRGVGSAWTVDSLTLGVTPTADDIILATLGYDGTSGPGYPTLTGFTWRMLLYYHDGTAGSTCVWLGEPSPYATSFGTALAFNWTSGGTFPGCEAIVYRLIDPQKRFRGRVLNKTVTSNNSSTSHSISAPSTPQARGGFAFASIRRDTGGNAISGGPGSGWDNAGVGGVLSCMGVFPLSRSPNALNPSAGTATWTTSGAAKTAILIYGICE